jgi:hypothetical protein
MIEGYSRLLPELKIYMVSPLALGEKVDTDRGVYTRSVDSYTQRIFPSPLWGDEQGSCGVATALFEIVNRQLIAVPVKFYALNNGNDLMGIFLTKHQADAEHKALNRRSD